MFLIVIISYLKDKKITLFSFLSSCSWVRSWWAVLRLTPERWKSTLAREKLKIRCTLGMYWWNHEVKVFICLCLFSTYFLSNSTLTLSLSLPLSFSLSLSLFSRDLKLKYNVDFFLCWKLFLDRLLLRLL